MLKWPRIRKWINDIFFSFPVQLVVLHIRSNLLLLSVWVIIALFMTGVIAKSFGIQYLFLDPEYLGRVDVLSFFMMGMAFGAFYMSWNLATYLLCTHYFPFLASLKRPFTKFCLNNCLIPLVFFGLYMGYAIHFQRYYEYWEQEKILFNMFGFTGGIVLSILLYSLYFQFANKDITYYVRGGVHPAAERITGIAPGHRGVDIDQIKRDENRHRVDTYLTETFRPRMVRSVAHYDSKLLLRIFRQNHLNALIVQLGTLLLLLGLGYLMDYPIFRFPAGASIFVLASIFVAIVGAVYYWLHKWRATILIVMLIVLNFLTKLPWFNHQNKAYGLDYTSEPAVYSPARLYETSSPERVQQDFNRTAVMLENWRKKVGGEKPKMIFVTVSGGGLKASVWTLQVLQKADSLLNGKLMDHTVMMSGASGGLMGAAYFRELYLRKYQGQPINPHAKVYLEKISRDLLNSIAFAIVANDLFLPFNTFQYGKHTYTKDRGYMFEKQLNENTDHVFDKPLISYQKPEQEALIPMMVISPSIVNDARRLLIAAQGVSYLTSTHLYLSGVKPSEIDAVDFRKIFKKQEADSLRFSTALRMNATYPYILPNVHLPSEPAIEVLDAGFRDNMGLLSAARFVQVYKDWIKKNTGGVILLQISSIRDNKPIPTSKNQGIIESLFNPLGILGHIIQLQDFEHDANLGFLYDILGPEYFDVFRFTYEASPENERASMTFHLTQREKNDILRAFYIEKNQNSLKKLKAALR